MPQRVTLDAMIPRADFEIQGKEFELDLPRELQAINSLEKSSPFLRLLRKPDFQRETNHWTPEQLATFIASFLDNEVIPGLILWKSPNFVFVIDGGHRLSALRAWVEDDYGDGVVSLQYYGGSIPEEQRKIAKRTRKLIERRIGRFTSMKEMVGGNVGSEDQLRRANRLFMRTIQTQWIQGSAQVAETSFFKINSQGTPLDETEEMLIRCRRKPIAIGARAILRSGAGHKYWSAFDDGSKARIEEAAADFYELVFKPEVEEPLKTLELSIGGSVSPVDALSLLIEFLTIAGTRQNVIVTGTGKTRLRTIDDDADDIDGSLTLSVLRNALEVVRYITGNAPSSLGLHPAVYFYNEKGKYNRFLFLGMVMLITEKLRNNDRNFFRNFTIKRQQIEAFLIDNKSLIGILLQYIWKFANRVHKMRDLLSFLVVEYTAGRTVSPEEAISHLGLQGKILDVSSTNAPVDFSDETKSMVFLRQALASAQTCPICNGKLDPNKSVSYDHKTPVRDGGKGTSDNCDLVHPYCNTGMKN